MIFVMTHRQYFSVHFYIKARGHLNSVPNVCRSWSSHSLNDWLDWFFLLHVWMFYVHQSRYMVLSNTWYIKCEHFNYNSKNCYTWFLCQFYPERVGIKFGEIYISYVWNYAGNKSCSYEYENHIYSIINHVDRRVAATNIAAISEHRFTFIVHFSDN